MTKRNLQTAPESGTPDLRRNSIQDGTEEIAAIVRTTKASVQEKPKEQIFQEALQQLCAEIEQCPSPEAHPDFYGKPGNNSYTYKREIAGKPILIKVYRLFGREYAGDPARCFSNEVHMLKSMKGTPHVPQILYSSGADLAIGMTILEGKSITTFAENPVLTCTDEQLIAFIETILKLAENGMYLELLMNSDNILFDKTSGLNIVDMSHSERKRHPLDYLQSFEFAAANTRPAMLEPDVQATLTKRIQFTIRFVKILKEKFPEIYADMLEINKQAPNSRSMYFSPERTMTMLEGAKRMNMLKRPEELNEFQIACDELQKLITV